MFLRRRPDEVQLRSILDCADKSPFSSVDVGFSSERSWNVDVHRVCIGDGTATFLLAKEALRNWRMFDMSWLSIFPPRPAIQTGSAVAVVVSHLGFWSVNVNRILYEIDEPDQYGFVYGTTIEHAETGEERFRVLRDRSDDSIWYEITAFSRPRHILARLGGPFTRALQGRFARDSMTAMQHTLSLSTK